MDWTESLPINAPSVSSVRAVKISLQVQCVATKRYHLLRIRYKTQDDVSWIENETFLPQENCGTRIKKAKRTTFGGKFYLKFNLVPKGK